MTNLGDPLPQDPSPDVLLDVFIEWVESSGISLYPHQEESLLAILAGNNVIVTTPTGSGKSSTALDAHFAALAEGCRTWHTASIKVLVNEKFSALCEAFGAERVGVVTGDASVNADTPIVCCTTEILASLTLRKERGADTGQVVMNELYFLAEPERGWTWQVPLVEPPQAQFMIISAALGDATALTDDLTRHAGRETAVISGATRPVPLIYRWSLAPLHETITGVAEAHQTPVYIVHLTQGTTVEQVTALFSQGAACKADAVVPGELKQVISGFPLAGGFGATLSKLLRGGIGVHHVGMLPRYRRLVEQLTQYGLLVVIRGADTLGVGIDVPIRTVSFSPLTRFDGRHQQVLRSREFYQITSRAGRVGFDSIGNMMAQAPEYEVRNARILAKHQGDEKEPRSVRHRRPPEGFVNYTQVTLTKLIGPSPGQLHARMRISRTLLLSSLQRDEETGVTVARLINSTNPEPKVCRVAPRRAAGFGRSLPWTEVTTRLPEPTPGGHHYRLNVDLQRSFVLNQPLLVFASAAVGTLGPGSPDYTLDVVSVIETTPKDPRVVLLAQQFGACGQAVAEMKIDGWDYEERTEALEEIAQPQPLVELLEQAHVEYSVAHPWLSETPVSPKSVMRGMHARGVTFGECVAHYKLQRTKGLLLCYLTDAYRMLRQGIPEGLHTGELKDLIAWLGEITGLVDSSLLDEQNELAALVGVPAEQWAEVAPSARPVTGNERAFGAIVRSATWQCVELCADDDVDSLTALTSGGPMTRQRWDDALGGYWDEHEDIGVGADAHGPAFFVVEPRRGGRLWEVRQIIDDPTGNHDWLIFATVDLDACDEAGEPVLCTLDFSRLDGWAGAGSVW